MLRRGDHEVRVPDPCDGLCLRFDVLADHGDEQVVLIVSCSAYDDIGRMTLEGILQCLGAGTVLEENGHVQKTLYRLDNGFVVVDDHDVVEM